MSTAFLLQSGPFSSNATAWQWQPTLTFHDPNPPITLEDAPAAVAIPFAPLMVMP